MLLQENTGFHPSRIDPGMIGDKSNAFSAEKVEVVFLQHIDP